MKKFAFIAAIVLCLGLIGCGETSNESSKIEKESSATSETTTTTTAIKEAESKAKMVYFAIENELRWGNAFSEEKDWSSGIVMKLSDLKNSDKVVDKAIYDSLTENYKTEDGFIYYEIDGWNREVRLAQWAESEDESCIVGQYSESEISYREDYIIGGSF